MAKPAKDKQVLFVNNVLHLFQKVFCHEEKVVAKHTFER